MNKISARHAIIHEAENTICFQRVRDELSWKLQPLCTKFLRLRENDIRLHNAKRCLARDQMKTENNSYSFSQFVGLVDTMH